MLPITLILKEFLINSINFLPRDQDVELVKSIQESKLSSIKKTPIQSTKYSSMHSSFENEINELIKTENDKGDDDKIQELLDIEKILNNTEKSLFSNNFRNDKKLSSTREEKNFEQRLIELSFTNSTKNNNNNNFEKTNLSGDDIINNNFNTSEMNPNNVQIIENYY